jgi:hypothetical protein
MSSSTADFRGRTERLALLAYLALDELTPAQVARVEERYELMLESDRPISAWLSERIAEAPSTVAA